ncbi:hypothetical protein SDC9_140530 [bioreactor metagenome]|uniref:DUF4044 domain-containing protein n=1 Tax=bioreactor metagenome TaxID=1076179 RepID=A0A645DXS2_9ZZZZ
MPWLRARADASPEPGGKEHPKNFDGGGKKQMNKGTRIAAIVIVGLLVFSLLASLVVPFMA